MTPGDPVAGGLVGPGAALVDGAPVAEVTLEGRHVRLEPLRQHHLDPLIAAATHPTETFRYTTVPADRAGMQRWLDEASAAAARGTALPFATVDRRDGAVVGSTRFGNLDFWTWPDGVARRPARNPDGAEIGWTWLAPRSQRTAINTEAKLLMLGHAFEQWRVWRVTLKTDARNQRSRDAIARLGCALDGVLRAWQLASDGGPRDTAIFSLLAGEWPAAKQKLQERLHAGRTPSE